jgi:hypothetical protein
MITPENNIPYDDSQNSEAEDQQSQKDIHSNGLDDTMEVQDDEDTNIDMLKQAYDASEPSYTLNLDDEQPKGEEE